tara:strand:+ start:186 stop:755 length:570 start_codon:yes stop_codon:yes gene_type:complete
MNYYETLYIVHPALESGRLKDIISSVDDNLKKLGGESLATELWGKRKLSYFIDKQKYGTYVLFQYKGQGKCSNNLSVELEHNPNILAYLTTSITSNDILDLKENIEEQIAGKSRENEKTEDKSKLKTEENDNLDKSKENDDKVEENDNSTEQESKSLEGQEANLDKQNEIEEATNQVVVDDKSTESTEE